LPFLIEQSCVKTSMAANMAAMPVYSRREQFSRLVSEAGNESMPKKIIINSTINLFLTAIGILVISNRNSCRVLFDKIVYVYFI